ncbi:MAG: ABC transporter permease [Synergistaceae bacterium]|jgi:peptide/nickel transport system permease protein|nr:ABC transporter permease [Synergistaceae bacterium]
MSGEKEQGKITEAFKNLRDNKLALFGLIVIIFFVFLAAAADVISPYENGVRQNSKARLQPPNTEHFFGTDHFGRDVFSRVIHGARISLFIGVATTLVSMSAALLLGSVTGYYGGIVDEIIMRVLDTVMCIPGLLLSLAVVSALGQGLRNLIIALVVSSVPGFTRLIRSVVLSIAENDYIEAARASGTNDVMIIIRHVLPNSMGPVIVQSTMSIARMIIFAAGFSFIGLGVQPPAPEWGSMLADAREFLRRAPYLMIFPGVSILLSSLSFNLLGDGLRDALDPKSRI